MLPALPDNHDFAPPIAFARVAKQMVDDPGGLGERASRDEDLMAEARILDCNPVVTLFSRVNS